MVEAEAGVVDVNELAAAVAVVVVLLVVLPLEMLEVVLEGWTEEDVSVVVFFFVAALLDECFPKVALSAPPRAAPNATRRAQRPMMRFLRERRRDFGDTAPFSFTSATYSLLGAAAAGSALAPSRVVAPWSDGVGV